MKMCGLTLIVINDIIKSRIMNPSIKAFVKSHSGFLSIIYYYLMNNRVSGKRGNVFIKKNTFLRGMRINFKGKNNEVVIGGRKPSAMVPTIK